MKTFLVTLFQYGVGFNANTNIEIYIDAETQDEAEQIAHDDWIDKGYGVWDSREWRWNISPEQEKQARKYADRLLMDIFPDNVEREEVLSSIEEDLYMDIEECSGWRDFEDENEWCEGDVEIALARVLKQRICG